MSAALATALGVIGLAAALCVGLLFTQAGLAKLHHRHMLPAIIANYRLLPDASIGIAATALPIVELAIGLALLVGLRAAIVPAAVLLIVFAGAMAINLKRGRQHIDCGCGRPELRQTLSWSAVARNCALAAILLPYLLPTAALGALDRATAMAAGVSLFLAILLFNAVGALAASPLAARRS